MITIALTYKGKELREVIGANGKGYHALETGMEDWEYLEEINTFILRKIMVFTDFLMERDVDGIRVYLPYSPTVGVRMREIEVGERCVCPGDSVIVHDLKFVK